MTDAQTLVSWDEWRARYPEWGVAQQRAFYDQVFIDHPGQQRFDTKHFGWLLDRVPNKVSVVELGGWDGEFAAVMLTDWPGITRWENFEISASAVAASACTDARYRGVALTDWYWATPHKADIFVASHVLEHLSLRDVVATFDATDCDWLFLQSPLGDSPHDWQGYHGTHILEVGWGGLTAVLHERGFVEIPGISHPWARCFEREGAS